MKLNVESSPSLDMPITRRQNRINLMKHYRRIRDYYPEDINYLTYNCIDVAQKLDFEDEVSLMERFTEAVKRKCRIAKQKIDFNHFNVMFCMLCICILLYVVYRVM